MLDNLIFKTDSYKVSHWEMIPPGTEYAYAYVEARSSSSAPVQYNSTLWYGIQGILKRHFSKPITLDDINEAEVFFNYHLGDGVFYREGWLKIVNELGGKLPLRVSAVPEGTVVPLSNVLLTIENTVPGYGWLVSYFEPLFLQVWYPTTVASISYSIRKVVEKAFAESVPNGYSLFKLHDFGFRGTSSVESSAIGASAHLVAGWKGTDTMQGMVELMRNYSASPSDLAYSIRATEHSIMCAWSDADTRNDFSALEMVISMLEKHKGIIACVGDTYSITRFAEWVSSDPIKSRIINSGGTLVLRPDSGNPVTTPVSVIKILMDGFGYNTNELGYKVLPDYIRVIQGDGINENSISEIYKLMLSNKMSADNIVFGMGGALLQHCDRDWLGFAMKTSAIKIDGEWRDLFKDPDTDSIKRSKKGRVVSYVDSDGKWFSDRIELMDTNHGLKNMLQPIWENGTFISEVSFSDIRVK